jgi:hypothetical protein
MDKVDASAWLAQLTLAQELEESFISAWKTGSWDPEGVHFKEVLQNLRKDTTLLSPLGKLIRTFLDLPPLDASDARSEVPDVLRKTDPEFSLTTHPSAGLSYLRTNSRVLHNHPLLGPQKSDPPIKTRVLGRKAGNNMLGVAGFAASDGGGESQIDYTVPGGQKAERKVKSAFVNGEGKIELQLVQNDDNEALGVREGRLERPNAEQQRLQNSGLLTQLLTGASTASQSASGVRFIPRPKVLPLESEAVGKLKQIEQEIRENGNQS